MIQCRLRELMAIKARKEGRRVTYSDITGATGIYNTTLTRLANDKAELIGKSTMDRLCAFFACQPGDLLVYVPAESGEPALPQRGQLPR
jgi:putative transcriptional regulator